MCWTTLSNLRDGCFSWRLVQELVDILHVPSIILIQVVANSLKTYIYHPVIKTISFLLKRSLCACLYFNWIHLVFIRHTIQSKVPLSILSPLSKCPPPTLFLNGNHEFHPTVVLSSGAVHPVKPGLLLLLKHKSESLCPLPAFEASLLSNLVFGGYFSCRVSSF